MREFKLGDKVCSVFGDGVVIETDHHPVYPIQVKFGKQKRTYTKEGFLLATQIHRSLFHIDEKPERWKIKKKVEITQWANVYEKVTHTHNTESAARKYAQPEAIAVAVKLTGEYEVIE